MQHRFSTLTVAALLGILAACGSGPKTAGIDRGGVAAPAAIEGPITGFGSIIVNDIHFDITSAQITANGTVVTEADLAIGQIVNVVGQLEPDGLQGTADTVVFEAHALGPITTIDVPAGSLTVLGQTVLAEDAELELDGAAPSLSSLVVGDVVEISGYVGAGGTIVATRIELENEDEYRIRGRAMDVDTAARTFTINALVLDYGSAFLVEGFPGGQPTEGDEIIAVGQSFGPSGELLVEQLRYRNRLDGTNGDEESEIEGLITRFVSPADFDVAGQPATANAATDYEGGNAGDLALNVKVQVEGRIDDSGVIVADKIEVKDGGRVY